MQNGLNGWIRLASSLVASIRDPAEEDLEYHQDVDSYADAVMRVGKRAVVPDCLNAQGEYYCGCEESQDVTPNVDANSPTTGSGIESNEEDGTRDEEKEGDGRQDSMGQY